MTNHPQKELELMAKDNTESYKSWVNPEYCRFFKNYDTLNESDQLQASTQFVPSPLQARADEIAKALWYQGLRPTKGDLMQGAQCGVVLPWGAEGLHFAPKFYHGASLPPFTPWAEILSEDEVLYSCAKLISQTLDLRNVGAKELLLPKGVQTAMGEFRGVKVRGVLNYIIQQDERVVRFDIAYGELL